MSDNLYSRNIDLRGGEDLDLWRITQRPTNTRNSSTSNININDNSNQFSHRRRVGFDVNEGIGDVKRNTTLVNAIDGDSMSSEPAFKIANAINSTVNLLAEHLITHPFIVIRRQAQVNRKSRAYHLTPFTIIPFVIRIERKQGFAILWKGIGSVFITKAMLISFEALIAELTPFPRDMTSKRLTWNQGFQHLILKGISLALMTPFLCSSCVETVQSAIASENPGVFDCIKEGFSRITHLKAYDRKLPVWLLCGPTVTYHLSHYIISYLVRDLCLYMNKENLTTNGTERENWQNQYKFIMTSFWANCVADIVLFPLQTIILRLYIQGTRTIIDNVEQSNAVTSVCAIISDYESTTDCYSRIFKEESGFGFFKGFGALVLQYAIHYSILRLTKYCVSKAISNLSKNERK